MLGGKLLLELVVALLLHLPVERDGILLLFLPLLNGLCLLLRLSLLVSLLDRDGVALAIELRGSEQVPQSK